MSGSFAAFGLGIAAPLVVEKLASAIPLTGTVVAVHPAPGKHSRPGHGGSPSTEAGGVADAL